MPRTDVCWQRRPDGLHFALVTFRDGLVVRLVEDSNPRRRELGFVELTVLLDGRPVTDKFIPLHLAKSCGPLAAAYLLDGLKRGRPPRSWIEAALPHSDARD